MEVPLTTLSWKLAWRYLRRHPKRKRLAFASVVSTAGVTLGVAALVIVMSVLGGLADFISKSVKAVDAPIALLSNNSSPLPDDSSFIASLESLPQVSSISPYIEGEAVARMPSRDTESGCLIRGVTESHFHETGLDTMLIWGTNLGPNMSYGGNSENNRLPRKFKIGLAYVPFEDELTSLLVAADYTKLLVEIDDSIAEELKGNKWGTGAEFWYYNLLALRAGYVHDTEGITTISGVTFGAGLQWNDFQLDMAFIPVEESLQGSGKYNQKYSLTLQF